MSLPVRQKFVKLVRDKVPDFYPGLDVVWQATDPSERSVLLKGKLVEEVIEYLVSGEVEELADVLEVVAALAEAQGSSLGLVLDEADRKRENRGAYAQMIGMYVQGSDHGDPRTDYDKVMTREPKVWIYSHEQGQPEGPYGWRWRWHTVKHKWEMQWYDDATREWTDTGKSFPNEAMIKQYLDERKR